VLTRLRLAVVLTIGALALQPRAATPIAYRFSFPEPEHHWLQVDATFTELDNTPLELRVSRSSPGRYSLHDFAKNVYDVHAFDPNGRELMLTRPDAYGWTVPAHGADVRVAYKVFGDRVDGTYLAIDRTHAHINMPAAVMWARGQDDRPSTITFMLPPIDHIDAPAWQVATQLQPGANRLEFQAPNLQYLMDSPAEFGPITMREFRVSDRTFRFAVHHAGADADVDAFVGDVEKIVREEGAIFGVYPEYEPGSYTFLADYLPYASGDGMEHRNSTVMTSAGSIRGTRMGLLDTVAHEFFHNWNVERIRPKSLEPFDFERANTSGELWLAEGFTQYYGPLVLKRTGLMDLGAFSATAGGLIRSIASNPARLVRSAEEMSRMAPFTDGGRTNDRTNWSNTVISYYSFGGAIGLALDLTLRERTDGRVTLDDYMRAMWKAHGEVRAARPGYVARPYTIADAELRLAEVSGDARFARDFFSRFIQGHEAADYARLLLLAGIELRRTGSDRATWGDVRLDGRNAVVIAQAPEFGSSAYQAGLDVGDDVKEVDGARVSSPDELFAVFGRHRVGDTVTVIFVDRSGVNHSTKVTLAEDVAFEIAPIESRGRAPSAAQKAFRDRWLGTK
jgi:predicted metalloprotease with PDZ domain